MEHNTRLRIALSAVTWITGMAAMVIITSTLSWSNLEDWVILPVLLFVVASMIIVNGFIWNWGIAQKSSAALEAEKGKRRSRVDSLVDTLSEEEFEALRSRMMEEQHSSSVYLSDDGELIRRR